MSWVLGRRVHLRRPPLRWLPCAQPLKWSEEGLQVPGGVLWALVFPRKEKCPEKKLLLIGLEVFECSSIPGRVINRSSGSDSRWRGGVHHFAPREEGKHAVRRHSLVFRMWVWWQGAPSRECLCGDQLLKGFRSCLEWWMKTLVHSHENPFWLIQIKKLVLGFPSRPS